MQVKKESVLGITSYPAPTYIVGIDEVQEVGYLVSANGENLTSLSSLSTNFPINKQNREISLYEFRYSLGSQSADYTGA